MLNNLLQLLVVQGMKLGYQIHRETDPQLPTPPAGLSGTRNADPAESADRFYTFTDPAAPIPPQIRS